eukprot:11420514-Karenia_brevis.AAC.1
MGVQRSEDFVWYHPEARQMTHGARIMGSFDGAHKRSSNRSGTGWHIWKLSEAGDRLLLAYGYGFFSEGSSVAAELTVLRDL